MKLLIHPAISAEHAESVGSVSSQVEVHNVNAADDALALIVDADAMYGWITPELLANAHRLRWVQSPRIGLETTMFPALVDSDVILTNVQGIFSDHIADHAMGYVLMFARGLHIYLRQQLARRWDAGVPVIHLADQTLGIIGLGGIGMEVAKRAKACGMRVIAVDAIDKAPPAFVDRLAMMDGLDDLLGEADFVVSCVPHTPETEELIGREQFMQMKPTAYLINISRGVVVDLDALTNALRNGDIAGAGLDVFEVEPLPAEHALWGMENVIITPHSAGSCAHTEGRRIAVLEENVRRFVVGEPLLNVVDKARWF